MVILIIMLLVLVLVLVLVFFFFHFFKKKTPFSSRFWSFSLRCFFFVGKR